MVKELVMAEVTAVTETVIVKVPGESTRIPLSVIVPADVFPVVVPAKDPVGDSVRLTPYVPLAVSILFPPLS